MTKLKPIRIFLLAVSGWGAAALSVSALDINFDVQNTKYDQNSTYIWVVGNNLDATLANGQPLKTSTPYSLAQLGGPIKMNRVIGGRIYLSVGQAIPAPPANNPGRRPSSVDPSDPSYKTRWDFMELTYEPTNTFSVGNLTSVDFFGLPLGLKTFKNGVLQKSMGYHVGGAQMQSVLGALANPVNGNVLRDASNNIVRLQSPVAMGSVYPSMVPYIARLKASTYPTIIRGEYFGINGQGRFQRQTYEMRATINAGNDLVLTGTTSVLGAQTIVVKAADVPIQIYAANPGYYLNGESTVTFNQNSVYDAIVRDILAGFNYGYVLSETIDPAIDPNTPLGQLSSDKWWKSRKAFSEVNTTYNTWAEAFLKNSDSYGFAYSDRSEALPHVLAALYNMDSLTVVIQPDTAPAATPVARGANIVPDSLRANAQARTVSVPVTRTDATQAETVDYRTVDESAQAGLDYTATDGSLAFAPGETSKTIDVPISSGALQDKAFKVELLPPGAEEVLDEVAVAIDNPLPYGPYISAAHDQAADLYEQAVAASVAGAVEAGLELGQAYYNLAYYYYYRYLQDQAVNSTPDQADLNAFYTNLAYTYYLAYVAEGDTASAYAWYNYINSFVK